MMRRSGADQAFVIATPSQVQSIPFRFEPGAQWMGLAEQDEKLERMSRDGYLFVVLYHSHRGGVVRHRVAPIPATTDTSDA